MRKCFFVMLLFLLFVGAGMAETRIDVLSDESLKNAMVTINDPASTETEFVINITKSFNTNEVLNFNRNVTTTILGNGNTITVGTDGHGTSDPHDDYLDSFIVVWNGTVNLGKENPVGNENKLTIKQADGTTGTDSSSCIQVIANKTFGDGSTTPELNMYKDVTISDWKVENSYGAAVRLYSKEEETGLTATFNMRGGTISNCEIIDGGNRHGGGVAVLHNGVFNMAGGTISGCRVHETGSTGGGVVLTLTEDVGNRQFYDDIEVNEPIFTMSGGSISGNGANKGGGISVLNGTFELKGGIVSNNYTDSYGGGVFLTGTQTKTWNPRNSYNSGSLNISGGSITHNYSTSFGGGVFSWYGAPVTMTGGILCNNKSTRRGDDLAAIYFGENITLSSASAMNQYYEAFQRKEGVNTWEETRFAIDGWYVDGDKNEKEQEQSSRWNYDNALGIISTNKRIGETIQPISSGEAWNSYWNDYDVDRYSLYVKAAFTAYNQIDITKTWVDQDNKLNTRPNNLTFTLNDSSGTPVKLRGEYDESTHTWLSGTQNATITIDATTNWQGTIGPLPIADYSSGYTLVESGVDPNYYVLKTGDPTISFLSDKKSDGTQAETGIYNASFTNIGPVNVTIVKIWDDVNDKDKIRPTTLNTQLELNGNPVTPIGATDPVITLPDDSGNWSKTVDIPGGEYANLLATEGAADGYTRTNYVRSENPTDGSITYVMINTHTLNPVASDTVANANMVKINYQAEKTWPDTPSTVTKPIVQIKLTGDNGYSDVQPLTTSEPFTATFENIPKYLDNDGNKPVTYTLSEVLNDPLWIDVKGEFYSLDGMGKYTPKVTNVSAEDIGSTEAGGTITAGSIENSYGYNQTATVAVTKLWKDHSNENGARPDSIMLGLFKGDTRIGVTTLSKPEGKDVDEWSGSITGIPLYDDTGAMIDYSSQEYVVKESYDDGDTWLSSGEKYTITNGGKTYTYDYSVVTQ